ncbi:MAG: NAD(P)/FAD-dependent oxidoreductase [Nevskiaceae bacterium]|nr:MAG: NAD(P)/FAD-dependent oxidoreductase [Nevskiaceae bacterium]TBR74336.1 MAG: NAD(P)/FAD-dependent oxidoreductase [Nevskiaceae bacterium]
MVRPAAGSRLPAREVDVLVIGAGLSGIGAACHLRRSCPTKTLAIIERRKQMGGTWDLFRYPGVRSDSDMYTFGFSFRPWTEPRVLADGASIRKYMHDTAHEYGVDALIDYERRAVRADWSSRDERWTVEVLNEATGQTERYRAAFIFTCTGYYNYDTGYRPTFDGEADFTGTLVHPQFWPEDLDYAGKNVVVIGSGATAITLVPSMAGKAAHVTMLQRSPTYILSVPAIDGVAAALQKHLPAKLAYRLNRARNVAIQRGLYKMSRRHPALVRKFILGRIRNRIGERIDMRHFTPSYNPWDQRLCVVPNGDLFKALKRGDASIETDTIDRFTEHGVRLKSGKELPADIIITATGLDVRMAGGMAVYVDGEPTEVAGRLTYKGVMLADVPNVGVLFGYTNASWTLKVDLAAEYLCRVLNHMARRGYAQFVAHPPTDERDEGNVMQTLSSGYVQRASGRLPAQGRRSPWRVVQDYLYDVNVMRYGDVEDGVIEFDGHVSHAARPAWRTPLRTARARLAAAGII